ncbi:MAG: glycosyl transferase family protein [Halothiobacillaceae bacterium]|nr:glycosyl transferase family protein [Halothiobacillaceae bacterium]
MRHTGRWSVQDCTPTPEHGNDKNTPPSTPCPLCPLWLKKHLQQEPTMHPFAPYIQILGKGRHGSRSLTQDEARVAMGMILDDVATPEQIGAFLMLIRVREETPEEAAGFVQAVRARIDLPMDMPAPAIDWGSYAGKRRHLPWFLLAARLLAQHGLPVFMHGDTGEAADRLYTQNVLAALGMPVAQSFREAHEHLASSHFAYLPLTAFAPGIKRLIQLRDLLGLRSPVHSVARMLNPLGAPLSVHGIFHRGYEHIHQRAACLLGEPAVLVFKGEGGEAEINPEMSTTLFISHAQEGGQTDWTPRLERRQLKPEQLAHAHLRAVWNGERNDIYGEAAVISTLAAVLFALGRADAQDQAQASALAQSWWEIR